MQSLDDYFTRWKSACFRRGTNLEFLSEPLQSGIRFFHHPIPAFSSAPLAGGLPSTRYCGRGEKSGLPRSQKYQRGDLPTFSCL